MKSPPLLLAGINGLVFRAGWIFIFCSLLTFVHAVDIENQELKLMVEMLRKENTDLRQQKAEDQKNELSFIST